MIVFENLPLNPKKDLLGGGDVPYPPPTKLVVLSKLLHLILLMNIYSVTRCTHEVRFIGQKKKCDVPLKFF